MRSDLIRSATFVAVLVISAAVGQADVYLDRASFDAANPGLPLLDFEGLAPDGDYLLEPEFPGSGVAFTDTDQYQEPAVAVLDSAVLGTPTDVLYGGGLSAGLVAEFDPPTYAIGFDIAVLSDGVTFGATVDLYSGANLLLSTVFDAATPYSFDVFRGFSNLGPIDRMVITAELYDNGGELLDNFAHGVPEPGAMTLLTLASLALWRRR